jgi:hypothetical protein
MAARVLAGACLLTLWCAAPGLADTTIGQTGGSVACTGGFVAFDTGYVVPAGGGVITSFSYADDAGNPGAQLDFEVLRPNPDGTYTIVGDTGLDTLTGAVGVETFPADIPAASGDVIGYYESGTDNCLTVGTLDDVGAIPVGSDPVVGETLLGPSFKLANFSLNESATVSTTAPELSVTGGSVSGTEGAQLSGSVATFSDSDNQAAGDYSATIGWGDGSSTAGIVSETSPGQYAVSGSHTYAEYGSYVVAVQVSDNDGATGQAQGAATVADAPISASGVGGPASPAGTQPSFSGQLATLTDQNPAGSSGDFTATIDWGDGTSSDGTVAGGNGSYTVSGSHPYAADGPYTVRVHVVDGGGSTADATAYLVVYENASQLGDGFLIGDLAPGPGVYFWGPRWAAENPMSGGSAPASFKGLADGSSPSCGQTFTATPGNSSMPPSDVPAYMAVGVTAGVTKSGAAISGDVVRVVVVKTDPAAPGAGQIVATLCG